MGPVKAIEMPSMEKFQHLQIQPAETPAIVPQLMPPPAFAPASVPSASPGGALMPSPRGLRGNPPPSQKVRALYDFDAGDPGELSFKTGDELVVITDTGEGWLMAARADGQQGLVPGNYVGPL